MNRVEAESQRIRRDMTEILGLSGDASGALPSSDDDGSLPSWSSSLSWRESRTLYEPKTPLLRNLANHARQSAPLSCPPTLKWSEMEATRSPRVEKQASRRDLSLEQLPVSKLSLRSVGSHRSSSSYSSPYTSKSLPGSPSYHSSVRRERSWRSDTRTSVEVAAPRSHRDQHYAHLTPNASVSPRYSQMRHTVDELASPKEPREHRDSDRPPRPMHPSDSRRSSSKTTKKSKKKKKKKKHSSKHSRSACSSNMSWSDGNSQRLTAIEDLHQDPSESNVSITLDEHFRITAVPSDHDDFSYDTDVTPRTNPSKGSLNSGSWTYRGSRYRQEDDSSTISSLDQSRKHSRRGRHKGERRKHSHKHPPTDVEFPEGMDSGSRNLRRTCEDRKESEDLRKVDCSQLRDLLSNYAKDPNHTDQGQLNELLDAFSETKADDESYEFSSVDSPSPSLHRSTRRRRVTGSPSTGGRSRQSLSTRKPSTRRNRTDRVSVDEHSRGSASRHSRQSLSSSEEVLSPTLCIEQRGFTNRRDMNVNKKEILEACGDDELKEFVSVPRESAMRRGHSSSSLGKKRVRFSAQHASTKSLGAPRIILASPSTQSVRIKSNKGTFDRGERRSLSSRGVVSEAPTMTMSRFEQEIYKAIDLEENSSILEEVRSSPKNSMERHKKEVLEVFGNDVHGAEEFVTVPLKPARSKATPGEIRQEQDDPANYNPPTPRPVGSDQEQKASQCYCSPRLLPRGFWKRMSKWHRSKQRSGGLE